GSDLRAWLFTLMHNLYLNQRRGLLAVQALDDQALATLAGSDDAAADMAMDLDRCLQRLPAEQRAVLLLVTLEDMAYADVARVLDIPVGTVMSRLSRARSRMRELMEPAPARPPVASTAVPAPLRRMK
ncbi:MAG TPA: RNA polymerase sigma factor, partial [Alicycliphilus sp.]|nr:RNA polymerase sigma factor [Alicycliphilus sp.]